MADTKISALTVATTPLAGTEVLPIVQSGVTKQVSVANLTAGRAVSADSLTLTGSPLPATSGGTGLTSFTANGIVYASSTSALTTGSALTFDGTVLNNTGAAPGIRSTITGGTVYTTLASDGVYTTGTDLYLFAPSGKFLSLYAGGAERARIPSAGGIQSVNSISVGNATPTTSGAGVTFPATQSASTDANTLDDYEEGTWTVGVAFDGGSTGVTYSGQQGTYTKVGRQVTCIGYFALTNKGSSTGSATITGLPFTVAANEPNYGGVAFGYNYQVSFADMLFGRTLANGTTIPLAQTTNAGVDSDIKDTNFTNASALRFTVTYFV